MRYLWLGLLIILIVPMVSASQNQPDNRTVGFLKYNGTLHFWNNNTIDGGQDYYINITDGHYVQITNHYEQFWTHNVFCLDYNTGKKCFDSMNNVNTKIETDNKTYINLTAWKTLNIHNRRAKLALQYHLKVNDTNLTVWGYIKNTGVLSIPNLKFEWNIEKIQINMTEQWDELWLQDNTDIYTGWTPFYFNESHDRIWHNTDLDESRLRIIDREPNTPLNDQELWLSWGRGLDAEVHLKADGSTTNETVSLIVDIGTLEVGQERQKKFQWLDIDPREACLCDVSVVSIDVGVYQLSDTDFTMACSWAVSGLCFSPTCFMYFDHTPTVQGGIRMLDDKYPTVFDFSVGQITDGSANPVSLLAGNVAQKDVKAGGRADTYSRLRCSVGDATTDSTEYNLTVGDIIPPLVNLTSPGNITQTTMFVDFFCNGTDNTQMREWNLYHNHTIWKPVLNITLNPRTKHYNETHNFTYNIPETANYTFGCALMDSDGNKTFSNNISVAVNKDTTVTLHLPLNNTQFNNTPENVTFTCDYTGNMGIFNGTLWHNVNGTFLPNYSFYPYDSNRIAPNSGFEYAGGTFGTSSPNHDNMLDWQRSSDATVTRVFDTDRNSWVANISFEFSGSNVQYLRRNTGMTWGAWQEPFIFEPNTQYIFSGWMKTDLTVGQGRARLRFDTSGGTDYNGDYQSGQTDWTFFSGIFITDSSMTAERVYMWATRTGTWLNGSVYIDDFMIQRYNTTQVHNDNISYFWIEEDSDCSTANECDQIGNGITEWTDTTGWSSQSNAFYNDDDYLYCNSATNCNGTFTFINLTSDGIYDIYAYCRDISDTGLRFSSDRITWQDECTNTGFGRLILSNITVANGKAIMYIEATAGGFKAIDKFYFKSKHPRGNYTWTYNFTSYVQSFPEGTYNWNCNMTFNDYVNQTAIDNWWFTVISALEDIETWQFAVSAGLILSAFVLIFLAVKLNSNHYPLKIFYISMSMFILFAHMNIMSIFADNDTATNAVNILQTVGNAYVWIIAMVLIFFILDVMFNFMEKIGDKFGTKKTEAED